MYYPFLRARQFELIALRELAIESVTQGVIVPILEPVKKTNNNLNLAHRVFRETGQTAYLIINPSTGEQSGDELYYLDYIKELGSSNFIPAFQFNSNAEFINQSIDDYDLNNCMLICGNDIDSENLEFQKLVRRAEIHCVVIKEPNRNRSLNRFIKELNKKYVRLDDLFEKRVRNSEFLLVPEHKFSEEHIYYKEDGFSGFSDYTVLPSEYIDGGSTPRAVVIHLTYMNEAEQIWIRHFTSETNDSISNVQGKFEEAAKKAVNFCNSFGHFNSAIEELFSYYQDEHYPGLGTVKKISIKNHLLVVSQFLKKK